MHGDGDGDGDDECVDDGCSGEVLGGDDDDVDECIGEMIRW